MPGRRARRLRQPLLAAVLLLGLAATLNACAGSSDDASPTPVPEPAPQAAEPVGSSSSPPEAAAAPPPAVTHGSPANSSPSEAAPPAAVRPPTDEGPSPEPPSATTPLTPSAGPASTEPLTPEEPLKDSDESSEAELPPPLPPLAPTVTRSPAAASPLVRAEDLGIREIPTAEALETAGLTHVRYAAGEVAFWEPGLYLLQVESGAVEGWVRPPDERAGPAGVTAGVHLSRDHRFLTGESFRYDRRTERAYTWGAQLVRQWQSDSGERLLFRLPHEDHERLVVTDDQLQPLAQIWVPAGVWFVRQWEWADADHLLFRLEEDDRSLLVVVDAALQTITQFTGPGGAGATFLPHPNGRHAFIADDRHVRLFDLDQAGPAPTPPAAAWEMPFSVHARHWSAVRYQPIPEGLAVFGFETHTDACFVGRYGLNGEILSEAAIPCVHFWPDTVRLSPDGRLLSAVTVVAGTDGQYAIPRGLATTVFDATTGAAVLRIRGADGPGGWSDDSASLSVFTRDDVFRRLTIDGQWAPRATPRANPERDTPEVFAEWTTPEEITVKTRAGETLASLRFRPFGEGTRGSPSRWSRWNDSRDELRVNLRISYYTNSDWHWDRPPLDPVIERAPFDEQLLVEVVVPCAALYWEPSTASASETCLPQGTVGEADDYSLYKGEWVHLRTDERGEGWVEASALRWAADGIWPEE